jgi:hypothetical protein
MSWKLWLDDQSFEVKEREAPAGFLPATSIAEAKSFINVLGLPEFMDLDHDLGKNETTMDFLKWLVEKYPDGPVPEYDVHSANPIGKLNIHSFLKSWKRVCGGQ